MSGIAGLYYLDGRPVRRADLEPMIASLAHRGPDASHVWGRGSLGLGHCMLWTTRESLLERLPMSDPSGSQVLTADARIDNRAELIRVLDLGDRPEREIGDSQLILAAYQAWGERCPERLLGDFAFAIWDAEAAHLFCARDHVGVKPFYYYYEPGRLFVFASEIKALLCLPDVPRRLNEVRVGDYLVPMLEDRSITFYQDILRLPPANTLTVTGEGIEVRTYWSLDPAREVRFDSDEEYAEAFRELFGQAINCRLRSVFPVGSMLSGGLDSSAVTCAARDMLVRKQRGPLHTFSYVFDQVPQCDERPFINAVLDGGGCVPHFVAGDRDSPLVDADRVLWHHDEAFLGPNLYLPWGLNRAVTQAGVRVLLTGFDGDTTVSHGFAYLNELAYTGRWDAFAEEAGQLARRFDRTARDVFFGYGTIPLQQLARRWKWAAFARGVNRAGRYFNVPRRHLWLQYGLKPLTPESMRRVWRWLRGRSAPAAHANTIVNPDFARRIRLKARVQTFERSRSDPPLSLLEDHWRSLTTGGLPYVLELVDRTAAAFSIEYRHPFMDKRLIEFSLALPPEQKIGQGWTRRVLRQAMAGILPDQVRCRTDKTNFQDNFVHTLLAFEREKLDELLFTGSQSIAPYLNREAVHDAYRRLASQKEIGDDDVLAVWKAANLALWLRQAGLSPTPSGLPPTH